MYSRPSDPDPLPFLSKRLLSEGMTASPLTVKPGPLLAFEPESVNNLALLLRQCTSIVSALSDGKVTYSVRLSASNGSASTDLERREVIIGLKPLLDPALTFGQRVSLAVAMAYHEVGHIIYSTDRRATATYTGTRAMTAHTVYNVAQDVHLEAMQARTFPGFAPALSTKEWFFGTEHPLRLDTVEHRRGALIAVALYREGVPVPTDPDARSWYDRAADWAARCARPDANVKKTMRALLAEGVALVEENVTTPLDPEKSGPEPDEPGGCGEEQDEQPDEEQDEQPDEEKPGSGSGGEDETGEGDETGSGEPDSSGGDEPDATEPDGSSSSGEGSGGDKSELTDSESGLNRDGKFGDEHAGAHDLHANTGYDAHVEGLARNTQYAIDRSAAAERITRDRVLVAGGTVAGTKYGNREVRVTRLPRR